MCLSSFTVTALQITCLQEQPFTANVTTDVFVNAARSTQGILRITENLLSFLAFCYLHKLCLKGMLQETSQIPSSPIS
jgi:hypothetical protein